ncbi:3'-5' ssDNA/RNA exonuclease TatD-like [Saccoglossus kowalevskii]|uniref:Deoxyribonuclease TATDN1 n=1 Tax=Saccoglossus kowalevskii TaxID=10224 RepID=A0ABM0GLK6_SACKO|nr:PREDICTED: deoxyribonuclease Tat-D-like [Saccoglossus kowalevskii]
MAQCAEAATPDSPKVTRTWFFLGNLARDVTVEDIIKFFNFEVEWRQDLARVELINDKHNRPKGHGFIGVPRYLTDRVMEFHERDFHGRKLKVERAKAGRYLKMTNRQFVGIGHGVHVSTSKQILVHPKPDMSSWPHVIDIGANLAHASFTKDLPRILNNAKVVGVQKIIVTGTSLKTSYSAQKLTQEHTDYLYFTAGVHPHDAVTWNDDVAKRIEKLCEDPACVAVGETGLDFERNFSPQDVQQTVFEKQIQLACKLKKPLFVHERKAFDDVLRLLVKYKKDLPPTVIHCFGGTDVQLETYLENGFYIGLTGSVFRDTQQHGPLQILIDKLMPLDKLMIETDSPFLFPDIKRFLKNYAAKQLYAKSDIKSKFDNLERLLKTYCKGHRNEPCTLAVTNQIIAILMGLEPEEVAKATTDNAMSFFRLT